jgi:hypothetical protein
VMLTHEKRSKGKIACLLCRTPGRESVNPLSVFSGNVGDTNFATWENFFFLWDWSLNSGLHACKEGALLLKLHLWPLCNGPKLAWTMILPF